MSWNQPFTQDSWIVKLSGENELLYNTSNLHLWRKFGKEGYVDLGEIDIAIERNLIKQNH